MTGGTAIHIQQLRIQKFKRMNDASMQMSPVNVLVGANNGGKSSIIQGLHFAISVLQAVELEGRFASHTINNPLKLSLGPEQLIYTPSDEVYSLAHGAHLREHADSFIRFEFTLSNGEETSLEIRKGRNRNIKTIIENPKAARILASLEQPFTIFSPGLAGVSKAENHVSDGVLLRALARGDANLVLRNILYRLWETAEWGRFMDDLHDIFPHVELNVEFDTSIDEHIRVRIRQGEQWVPLELAGTGVLQAIQILSYIHRFAPRLIVLDEPDSHLHPNNQRLLCALLQKIADERETYVLMTTHSRHVVDTLREDVGFLWVREGTVDSASMDDEIGVLLDIGALDVKERAGHPETEFVVLTEDKSTKPLEVILESSGFNMAKTAVLPYYGITSIKNLRPLISQIQATNPNATIVVHRDRDYLTDDEGEAWQAQIRKMSVVPFLTDGTDIESHFIQPAYLSAINPSVSILDWHAAIDAAYGKTEDKHIAKFVNSRLDIARKAGLAAKTNPGELAVEANKKLNEAPARWRHGKVMLSALRAEIQGNGSAAWQKPHSSLAHPTLVKAKATAKAKVAIAAT